jgi:REP element-mobilizing transposase RayT
LLRPDKHKDIIVSSLKFIVEAKRVKVYGYVIMPNHLHMLWKIPLQRKLEEVQRDFMKYSGQMINFDLFKHHPEVLKQ